DLSALSVDEREVFVDRSVELEAVRIAGRDGRQTHDWAIYDCSEIATRRVQSKSVDRRAGPISEDATTLISPQTALQYANSEEAWLECVYRCSRLLGDWSRIDLKPLNWNEAIEAAKFHVLGEEYRQILRHKSSGATPSAHQATTRVQIDFFDSIA